MVTERTTKEIIEQDRINRIFRDKASTLEELEYEKWSEQVWVLKEDYDKLNEQLENMIKYSNKLENKLYPIKDEEPILKAYNSPPDDGGNSRNSSVLKKDSEEDANRSLHPAKSSVVAPEGSTPSASEEDNNIPECNNCEEKTAKGSWVDECRWMLRWCNIMNWKKHLIIIALLAFVAAVVGLIILLVDLAIKYGWVIYAIMALGVYAFTYCLVSMTEDVTSKGKRK